MSDAIRTNIVTKEEKTIYPITLSELVITESEIPLETMINSKANANMSIRYDGLNEHGFANLSYYNESIKEWIPVGTVAAAELEACGWETEGPNVIKTIQDIQRDLLNKALISHKHTTDDISNIQIITERITMLENNPPTGAPGKDGANGKDGADGLTPHIDPIDGTWRIGYQNTGVVAKGRNGADFTSRWNDQRFISIGSTITWQDGQFMNGQTIIGYQNFIRNQLGFDSYNTIAQEDITVEGIITFARNANYNLYNLAIIEIGISDYRNNVPIVDFEDRLLELINIIHSSNTTIPIIIFTPIHFQNTSDINNVGHSLLDYIKSIFKISNNYAIPVCDLYHNSGITPKTISNFSNITDRLNNAGFARISLNTVGAVHMFNGSSIVLTENNENNEEEVSKSTESVVVMPHIDGDATELLQYYINKGSNHPLVIIFPKGEWNISSVNLQKDTTLLLSDDAVIKQLHGSNISMFVSKDTSNINIVNGTHTSQKFCEFNNCKNVVIQNVLNDNGAINFKNTSNIKLSGHFNGMTTLVDFEHCDKVKLDNITFQNCNYPSALIKFFDCSNVDVDNLYDYDMMRTNLASAILHISQQCSHIRIGENIDLGIQTLLNTAYDLHNLIYKGYYETLWSGEATEGDFAVLSFSIDNFENICFHFEDESVIPVDFRGSKVIIKDHITDDGHTFLRDAHFVKSGTQVIHFEHQTSAVVIWASVEEDENNKSITEDTSPQFESKFKSELDDNDDIIIDGNPDQENDWEWEAPKAPLLKIVKITGERIKF